MSATRTSLFARLFGRTPKTIRRPKPSHRARLGLTALEAREVPAYLWGGHLWIVGTDGPDNVTVSETYPTGWGDTWYGNVSVKVVHNNRTEYFSPWGITGVIQFLGQGGNDVFQSSAGFPVAADGGTGRDVLSGGPMNDWLNGGSNDDAIYGNGGDDYVLGGQGNDEIRGGAGNDTLYGEGENDTIRGGPGDDILYGNAGNDTIYGDNNAGTAGGEGNDTLYGGTGTDTLMGEGGNDGLFGGVNDGVDYLYGQAGADRLLMPAIRIDYGYYAFDANEDATMDFAAEDARITFRSSPALTGQTFNGQDGEHSFDAGSWDNAQIYRVDVALANLHRHVGNTRLLKTAARGEMSFRAVGMQTSPGFQAGGWNNGTEIVYVTPAAKTNAQIELTVYHEFGHNWDDYSENQYVDDFRNVSGWQVAPSSLSGEGAVDDGYLLSTDAGGTWEYLESAANTFAREYGKTNPLEDMGTTWEAYFVNRYHGGTDGLDREGLSGNLAKWDTLDSLFWDLRSAP